ncbi:MAG: glycosyltransferase [Solobacterium sp.]|nr:glycosyltransferase [Solobacterium sp.]
MPAISVIIPVYNTREEYLRRCLDRFVMDDPAVEVIVVNDGSRTETVSVLEEYTGMISSYRILHQENQGVSAARNQGIQHAEGEWITFCDADDEVNIQALLRAVHETSPETDMIYSSFRKIRKTEKEVTLPAGLSVKAYTKNLLCHANTYGTVWAKIYSRKLLQEKNVRFNEELSYGEDAVFLLEYLRHCTQILRAEHPFYLYHFESSLTSRSNPEAVNRYLKMLDTVKEHYSERISEEDYGSFCNTHLMIILANYIFIPANDKNTAMELLHTVLEDENIRSSLHTYNKKETSPAQNMVIAALKEEKYGLCEWIFRVYRNVKN